jgi:hypothetical protein
MAGNSSGWIKPVSPLAPKGKLFISLAQAKKYAQTDDPKVAYAAIHALAATPKIAIIMDLVNIPTAKARGLAPQPEGWTP